MPDASVTFSGEAIPLLILFVAHQKPSRGGLWHPILMQFYSGPLMHLLSGVDRFFMSAPIFAFAKLAPLKSNRLSRAMMCAPEKLAPLKTAASAGEMSRPEDTTRPRRLALDKSAFVKFARMIQARSSFAPERLAPERSVPTNFAPKRFALDRFARLKSRLLRSRFSRDFEERSASSPGATEANAARTCSALRSAPQQGDATSASSTDQIHLPALFILLSRDFRPVSRPRPQLSFACQIGRCCICSKSTARFLLKVELCLLSLRTGRWRFGPKP